MAVTVLVPVAVLVTVRVYIATGKFNLNVSPMLSRAGNPVIEHTAASMFCESASEVIGNTYV
jgi:hypothetical protein